MDVQRAYPWHEYLTSVTQLNDWEMALFAHVDYDETVAAEEACHVALDVINLMRKLEFDTSQYAQAHSDQPKDAMTYCAELIGQYCGSGQAAPELLSRIGTKIEGNEGTQVRLRALHGMLRICGMPGVSPLRAVPRKMLVPKPLTARRGFRKAVPQMQGDCLLEDLGSLGDVVIVAGNDVTSRALEDVQFAIDCLAQAIHRECKRETELVEVEPEVPSIGEIA